MALWLLKKENDMANMNDAQGIAYRLANPAVVYNPNSAIAKHWLWLKAQGTFIGVPIGNELKLDNGTVTQSFTSGAVLRWTGGDVVEVS